MKEFFEDWKILIPTYIVILVLSAGAAYLSHLKEQSIFEQGKTAGKTEIMELLAGE